MALDHYIMSTGEMVDLEEIARQRGLPPTNSKMELLLGTELRPVCPDCGHEAELNSHGRCYRCERDLWARENGPSGDQAWFNRDAIADRREMDQAAQDAYREMIGRV